MTVTASAATAGLRRAIWSSILERDIDFMLVDLLHTSASFRRWLIAQVADDLHVPDPGSDFLGAWHSVTTPNGESDVEAEWQLPEGGRFVLLFEDKIGAAFQPEQGARYRERAANYVSSGRAIRTRLVLVASAGYPRRDPEGAAPFERHLAWETLRDWCRMEDAGEGGSFLASFLDQALRRAVGGGRLPATATPVTTETDVRIHGRKPQFPEIHAVISECLCARSATTTRLVTTNSSPGEWVYFDFDGRGAGVSLRWRLQDHWVELVLRTAQVPQEKLEQALATNPFPGGAVAPRGTSEVVVWASTPEVDLLADAAMQREAVEGALEVVAALAVWYVDVRHELEGGSGS